MSTKFFALGALIAALTGVMPVHADPVLAYAAQTQPGGSYGLYWTVNGGRTPPQLVQSPLGSLMNVAEYDFVPRSTNLLYRANVPPGPQELYLGGTLLPQTGRKINAPLPSGRSVTQYALSANSTSIAFISDASTTGTFDVYATRVDGTLAPQKVNAAPVSGGNVVGTIVSPDGNWLAYRGDLAVDGKFEVFASNIPTSTTWRINADLGATEDVTTIAISPDSAKLAFLVNQSTASGLKHRLFSRAIQGTGSITGIGDTGAGGSDIVDFKFSPLGSKIALLEDRDTTGQFELYLVNADGSGSSLKVSPALGALKDVQTFTFSPNGQWLAFESNVPGPGATQGELFLYSVANGGAAVKVNQIATGNAGQFAFSADSAHLVYQQAAAATLIYDLYERPTSLASAEHKINESLSAGKSIEAFAVGAESKSVAYIGFQANVGTLYLSSIVGAPGELQVNPAGQSVAAIITAPIDSKSSAGGAWNDYR